ncbi:hypothetical protein CVS30_00985 [Arthrobacter psychrolactophilus]|uniref:DUF8083 domain-containing protein n=1 Tax=Arthrobacter psychrolactophilus TaxID=92442 RepID=A0A2V5IVP9_9MICC|nr:hypothetical protein [Arthrobacter psychrolactophilus]PYI40131.1 hypothetical protein CVS30_00985 [Arthrobacter psychrolactophilus]
MTGALYLGGVQLPFVSTLRVYLPREAYSLAEFAHLERLIAPEQNAVSIDIGELGDSLVRVSKTINNPLPTSDEDRVRTLTLGEGEATLYSPNQLVARSIASVAELMSGGMEQLATLVLSQAEWSQSLEHASESQHFEMPLQSRSSTWGVPFSWFILVYANDRMEVVEANGQILTVRIQIPLAAARSRAERTLKMLAAMAPDLDLLADLTDLLGWLEEFGEVGMLELDYGPVANRVHPDDSPADVHMGLECLAEGDFTGAAAAYRRLANRWMPIRQLARAN